MSFEFSQIGILDELPSKIQIEEHGITVSEMIRIVSERYGFNLDEKILNDGELNDGLLILKNGTSIANEELLSTIIEKDASVILMAMVYGG